VNERRAERCTYFTFPQLDMVPDVTHGVFSRLGGYSDPPYHGLNLVTSTGDDPMRVERNRTAVSAALGLPLAGARVVHGTDAVVITRDDLPPLEDDEAHSWVQWLRAHPADALVTDVPGFALFLAFADCAPVLLCDPTRRVIALVHAGWRGTAQGIVPRTIALMREHYGTRPDDLLAAIGPAIGACCYEINAEVTATFAAHPIAGSTACFERRNDGRTFLDVARSNEGQLLAAGVPQDQIECSGFCTGCRTDLFYSHRREPKPSGRFGVGIGLLA
jgi:polyphenol oxidase